MEPISVFEIFKIGVGPSSSHTLGPWRAALRFLDILRSIGPLTELDGIEVDLYGSLAKTGKGHGTDLAVLMGLKGADPTQCASGELPSEYVQVQDSGQLLAGGKSWIPFSVTEHLRFHRDQTLPFHPNGLTFTAYFGGKILKETFYSVGGGFVVQEADSASSSSIHVPHPILTGADLEAWCKSEKKPIDAIVQANELCFHTEEEIIQKLDEIVAVMETCVYAGCQADGFLPGGLKVKRRAKAISESLLPEATEIGQAAWFNRVRHCPRDFESTLKWVSCFALAVNEQNAAYGRVVTAPTNGAAGVIPAVLLYAKCFTDGFTNEMAHRFLITAAQIGMLFKAHATISAAMGGCQAEIGVSSSMAAAGLTAIHGGSVGQCLMAAEIAMEHHLGMTCDPIGGLVQIPCIERNTMGAIKAITASQIGLASDPLEAKVSLDAVIETMWQTSLDMNGKYKETSEGGLAVKVPVNVAEC